MYKIVGVDGKEYGPIGLEQLKQWAAEGRINAQTRIQSSASTDWKPASEFPELSSLFVPPVAGATAQPPPALLGQAPPAEPKKGLAIASFVLGILSVTVCFGLVTGLPAIICGHLAHNRARRAPAQYGGAGFAIAGFVLGYLSACMTLILLAILLPALSQAKGKAQDINCVNNLKQIGLAFRVWAVDHNDQFPFHVSTNAGGTLELSKPGDDGFERNPLIHFQVMSNELSTPRILVCPNDPSKRAASNFESLQPVNLSYRLRSGISTNQDPTEIIVVCPIHDNVLYSDGSVQRRGPGAWKGGR